MYGRLAKVIAISRQTKDALDRWLDYCDGDSEKVVVVNNGISLVPVEAPSRALPEKTVLMVSRFTEAKDHATVLRAMKHISTPGVTLAFAGTGATMDSCRRLALELGIQNQVLFLGDRDDAQALMAQASIRGTVLALGRIRTHSRGVHGRGYAGGCIGCGRAASGS